MKAWVLLLLLTGGVWAQSEVLRVGSKPFPESWVLGEALCKLARQQGAQVEYLKGLGGTEIIYQALKQGKIDVYPEYTGTIKQVFLKHLKQPSDADALEALALEGLGMSYSLGFSNGYALAVPQALPEIESISDLAKFPQLRYALNQEFVARKDGWVGLSQAYGLQPQNLSEMQHELAYTAIKAGKAEVVNVYTTDAQIENLGVRLLRDDRHYFPNYEAVLLYRADLPARSPRAWAGLMRLVGRISAERMRQANAKLVLHKQEASQAADFLLQQCLKEGVQGVVPRRSWDWWGIARRAARHLQLAAISLSWAVVVGIPLGILASRSPLLARMVLSFTGLLQTIPSLALLAFLIPITSVGSTPALIALFIYSLLPIVRNTHTGLTTLPGNLSEAADALGLPPLAQMLRIRLPMASPAILAGIKTSAVINVGTATLAALVGAGGLGELILQGINLLDNELIFQGAIPAALLALLAQGFFDLIERWVVPRGLRI